MQDEARSRPLRNRVSPFGEIVAEAWRGALMGNRGRLHDAGRHIGSARWRGKAWIACRLAFRGRRREPMPARGYTALFFWDEAMAFAAGHRPCAECRRADYLRFRAAWAAAGLPGARAVEIDAALHAARLDDGRRQRRARMPAAALPDGAVVAMPDGSARAALVWQGSLYPWSPALGYAAGEPAGADAITVLTPLPILAVFEAGYRPEIRPA